METAELPEHIAALFPFPLNGQRHTLFLRSWGPWSWGAPLRATIQQVLMDADGTIQNVREAEVILLHPHHFSDVPWSAVQAAIATWVARIEALTPEEAHEIDFFDLMPWAEEEAAALGERYATWIAENLPESAGEADVRRRAALAKATEDWGLLSDHVRAVWGLELPQTLVAFQAFFLAIADWPLEITESAGVRPGGILDRVAPGGWDAVPLVDERVHVRFRRDPPEFLTFAWGDSDGQHFGFWFDDRDAVGVVHNYARDSAETWPIGRTALAVLRHRWQYDEPVDDETGFPARRFLDELSWFERHDPAPALPPWTRVGDLIGGPAASPPGRSRVSTDALSRPAVNAAIDAAMASLAAGDPIAALSLGRELWWMDDDATRDDALALLVGAYAALGRTALVGIVNTHAAHRDRPFVNVFED
jgi:hypothetical protein